MTSMESLLSLSQQELESLPSDVKSDIMSRRTSDAAANVLSWLLHKGPSKLAGKCPPLTVIYAKLNNPTCCKACNMGCVCGPSPGDGACSGDCNCR